MHRAKRYFLATAIAALLMSAASLAKANDIAIGVPIAQTGIFAYAGVFELRGIQLAAEQANESGMFGADRVSLVIGDDATDRTQTVTLVSGMIERDKVIMIVGPEGTPTALASGAVANDRHVPMLSEATSSAITEVGTYVFHTGAAPDLQISSAMQYAYDHLKPKTVATLWARDNEGTVAQGRFARQWFEGKAALLPEDSFLGTDTDFSAIATKLAAAAPDILMIFGADASAANIAIQMRQAGVKSAFIGSTSMAGPGFPRLAGKAAEGTLAPADYLESRNDQINQDFVAAYTKKYGTAPNNWDALGYTAMQVALHAIKAAGPNATRDSVREALSKTQDMPSVLGAGTFSFNSDREPSYKLGMLTVKDGVWVPAPK